MPRRRKPLKIKLKSDTLYSVIAVMMFMLGLLVMVSFTGQGMVLVAINAYLIKKIGLGALFLPFVFISSGLVMTRTNWTWSKPNVLLGTLLMMMGTVGAAQTGEVGQATFVNLAKLVAPVGSYIVFGSLVVMGAIII